MVPWFGLPNDKSQIVNEPTFLSNSPGAGTGNRMAVEEKPTTPTNNARGSFNELKFYCAVSFIVLRCPAVLRFT